MKFAGIPYPISKHPRGYFRSSYGVQQIKSDLLQLLLTNPGERVMLPDYGTPLKKLMFEQNDASLESTAREMIINSIRMWEPRITVQQIEVSRFVDNISLNANDPQETSEQVLMVKILFFDPDNIQEVEELKMELPINGGQ